MKLQIIGALITYCKARGVTIKPWDNLVVRTPSSTYEFDEVWFTKIVRDDIKPLLKDPEMYQHIENRRLISRFNAMDRAEVPGGLKELRTKNLVHLANYLKAYLKDVPRHWAFIGKWGTNEMEPYWISNIQYHPPVKHTDYTAPAYVNIHFEAVKQGTYVGTSKDIYKPDLLGYDSKGATCKEVLTAKDVHPANDELIAEYDEQEKLFNSVCQNTGLQIVSTGVVPVFNTEKKKSNGWGWHDWGVSTVNLSKDAPSSRLIVDDSFHRPDKDVTNSKVDNFWDKEAVTKVSQDDDDEEEKDEDEMLAAPEYAMAMLPTHPYFVAFDLTSHSYVTLHIQNCVPYEYDKTLGDKLILPKDDVRLIKILLESSKNKRKDIIAGKGGGTIVLSSGEPGTGKTLTAQIFAEQGEAPLYVVQCSQLGTSESDLEKKLSDILVRTQRWGAILQIDEADVYIRARGEDINQNAIVGVFLRLLEYFNGVMFMTTNRQDKVDDAIMSRLTAWVRYNLPTPEDAAQIWRILSAVQGIEIPEALVPELASTFKISGRSIGKMINLAGTVAKAEGCPLDLELFKWASKYQDLGENAVVKES